MVYENISIKPGPGAPTLLSTSTLTETLSAHRTILQAEIDAYTTFALDPDGAKNVTLPDEASSAGAFLFISNEAGGAEAITVLDSAGTGTVGTPTQNEGIVLWCDGTTWRGIVGAMS